MKLQVYIVRVTCGNWVHEYPMVAVHGCTACTKAHETWGEKCRVSARPKHRKE